MLQGIITHVYEISPCMIDVCLSKFELEDKHCIKLKTHISLV